MSVTITASKAILRKEVKQRISQLTKEAKHLQSSIIAEKLIDSSEYKSSQRLSLYLSMPDEVYTLDILKDALTSGKQCFVPRYTSSDMEMLRITSLDDYDSLPVTKWNIKQPRSTDGREEALSTGGLDLILCPGLAFTKEGCRLGRGKGYYDNYLSKCGATPSLINHEGVLLNPKHTLTIGLAFNEQIVDYIPTHGHDIHLDKIMYPSCS